MEPEGSGEHPKILGGGYNARWKTEVVRAKLLVRRASKGASPERLVVCEDGRELPKEFWSPKTPVEPEGSDEHPKTLGGCLTHWWGTEVLRALRC